MADGPLPLTLLPDFREEGWPSMDLTASMLAGALARLPAGRVDLRFPQPAFRRVATRVPGVPARFALNADRVLNRLVAYPQSLRRIATRPGGHFLVCDHTYANLVHALPAERTGVFCHDLVAFQCLLEPARDPRPWWFRRLAARAYSGLRSAAVVFHSSPPVGDALRALGLAPRGGIVHAPYGIGPAFTADAPASAGDLLPAPLRGARYVMHVGSCVARKRIDVLLEVFAQLRARHPELRLLKVDGEFTAPQRDRIDALELAPAVCHLTGVPEAQLVQLYRGAAALLQPSDEEGFGLPVLEALACGAGVVASDLPVLRYVGGPEARYAPIGDVGAWTRAALDVLAPADAAAVARRRAWARQFSWDRQAETVLGAFERLAGRA